MISELNDEEILEFLMTSDFEQDYKPEELKYLLTKWRYFYRLLHGRLELVKSEGEGEINKLKEEIKSVNNLLTKEQIENSSKSDFINALKNRKLSFKERITGKITIEENEN
jgi:hypothetical protein